MAPPASLRALPSWRPTLAVARWVVLRGLRQPAVGLLGLGLLLLVPLQARLSPLGDVGLEPAWRLGAAWIAPVGILGAALALGALGQGRGFLELLPPRVRLAGEGLALTAGAVGLQGPLLLGAAWIAREGPGLAPWAWLGADLHLAGVGLLLLRWKAPTSVRVGVFAGLLWFLPAMLPGQGSVASALALFTDAGRFPTSLAEGSARALLVVGLWLASDLVLDRPPGAPRSVPR